MENGRRLNERERERKWVEGAKDDGERRKKGKEGKKGGKGERKGRDRMDGQNEKERWDTKDGRKKATPLITTL